MNERRTRMCRLGGVFALFAGATAPVLAQSPGPLTTEQLEAFEPRPIGPAVTGGRIHDIEALPDRPSTILVASASGGLWKTTNRGQTWRNVFDDQPVSTFGDVAISESNPSIVYAGTGEQNNRQSSSWGNGVYRSDDGGETWRHLGLDETRHIGRVRIHPRDPDVVYVAALGNLWRASEERGVFRSRDGGATWDRVLHVDQYTGAVDLVMDPANPDVVYAATYQRLRRTWGFNGGGPGSGIYKSVDGGDTWEELTDGVPAGDKGRIGLAVSASNPRVLNALIEHETQSGTYRSEDAGASWTKVNDLNSRPMYYSQVVIDPSEENRIYVLSTTSRVSNDGGRTFSAIAEPPTYDVGVHADHHALWIDPSDSDHLYLGGDAGLYESYDRGGHFRKINNFLIGQFYDIGIDMREPYNVYGGMQDNHSWMGPSRTRRWAGIINDDWKQIGFGDGMYWQIDPDDPRFAYGNSQEGGYTRVDTETGDILDIRPRPRPGEPPYRWDWASPSLVSLHSPSTIYLGGNRLFTSRDRGLTWGRTEDLTRAIDRDQLELMGVPGRNIRISRNDGVSSFGEITVIAESPVDPAVLWIGTDDGNLKVTTDGGATWLETSQHVEGVADGTYVSRIVASRSTPGTAYVAFDAHRDGDFDPYLFRTRDFGVTWEPLVSGLPSGSVNALVEHPDNVAVLFLGTEHHLFVSIDEGASWARMPNVPTTAYEDLVIHPRERDLVIGTHGRGIWILDDTSPLAQWNAGTTAPELLLFPVRGVELFQYWKDTSYRGHAEYAGVNPASGAMITYRVGSGAGRGTLTVTDLYSNTVRQMIVPGGAGVHRVNWDLRHGYPGASTTWAPHDDRVLARDVSPRGPFVSPGAYNVTLEVGGSSVRQVVEVRGDPLLPVTQVQYQERESFLLHLLALRARAQATGDRVPGDSDAAGTRGTLRGIEETVRRVYESINGDEVMPGTLYPPTGTQRDVIAAAENELNEIEVAVAQAGSGN